MKDNTQEMLRRARELMGSGQVFQPLGMDAAKVKLEQHLNGGISNARDRLRESAQCEQTVLALNDLLNQTQKHAMLVVSENERLRARVAELEAKGAQAACVPEGLLDAAKHLVGAYIKNQGSVFEYVGMVTPLQKGDATYAAWMQLRAAILSTTDTEVKK